jgi:hypothetical protein
LPRSRLPAESLSRHRMRGKDGSLTTASHSLTDPAGFQACAAYRSGSAFHRKKAIVFSPGSPNHFVYSARRSPES